jgi:mono/diheme cytochrome c family protein
MRRTSTSPTPASDMRISHSRQILFAVLLLALANNARAADSTGAAIYQEQCARCHGAAGEGTPDNYPNPLVGDHSISQLAALIAESMPEDQEQKCPPADAQKVAAYIYDAFYSPEAQFRNKPARVELSRLTVRQHQNAVTDLIGSFRRPTSWGDERGLVGRYFAAREFRDDARKIERTDAQVHFDFGVSSPEPDKFDPHSFSISWAGSLLAPDTGEYEFIVRTEHATRLWVNNHQEPLIDAWVKSGDDTEYRAEIRLLAGRAYPLKLEFSKSTQGVGDGNKRKKKPKPTKASISLEWKRPYHTAEVIPARNLSVTDTPQSFVLHAPFPPDDRSVGYERGTAISKAWDGATTEAAVEVAGYVAEHVNELAGVNGDAPDREALLIDFCHTFAERAFRRPLSDEQRLACVDRQFAEAADPDLAVKRVALLVLKSPRFLYREVGDADSNDPYNIAARLSFGLWDSIPDETLRHAAADGRMADHAHVSQQIRRMLPDPRAHAKLREFLLSWLKVGQPPDVSKDPQLYPEFTPETLSDLRTSLELSIDDVLTSKSADYRQLLLGDSIFLNGKLAAIYGAELPKDAPFEKVRVQPEHRSGLVSHPYLLACFAYANSSSPIHRGVFITRNLLGRSLRQPPEAVAPLPVELHADLTTRERVTLQTKPDACQSCHSMINPLGFSLEEFDAIGRYREVEKNRAVDAAGSYRTKTGNMVEFDGASDLAQFLANSDESQAAFVRQLFHHIVKQPVRAYGPDRWEQLQRRFVEHEFNIHKLLAEIVAASALVDETRPSPQLAAGQ